MACETLVEMRNITKAFYGVTVFENLSLSFQAGEVHCICGENGSGKSTLIKILSGAYQPNGGEIYFEGKPVHISGPIDALRMGIQTVYQETTLFSTLQVYENLFAGREHMQKDGVFLDKKSMVEKTRELLDYLSVTGISPYDIVGNFSTGEQKLIEIARGLVLNAKVMILDEPTSSFSRREIRNLFTVIKKLKEQGITVIFISHHLEEVFELADRVSVLRDGKLIFTRGIEDLTYKDLINSMVGRDVESFFTREQVETGEVLFEAKNLCGNGVENISFAIRRGEILGFSGMVGAGKTEIAELLFGQKPLDSGEMYMAGEKITVRSPKDAIRHKMCFITESRQFTGLFLEHSIHENVVLPNYNKTKTPWVNYRQETSEVNRYVKMINIVTTTIKKKVRELSGGNQQKVVLAKWFLTDGDFYIFDEPTRGIDIGAREEIYKLMTKLLHAGKAILMISSDMPELISMSNRIAVIRNGRVAAELSRDEFNEEAILNCSIGGNN